jgi:hypothetical protein
LFDLEIILYHRTIFVPIKCDIHWVNCPWAIELWESGMEIGRGQFLLDTKEKVIVGKPISPTKKAQSEILGHPFEG